MKRLLLGLVLAVAVLPFLGCTPNPTPAATMSPEDEKRFEEELKKSQQQEAGQKKIENPQDK